MGRSALQSTKDYIEDFDRRYNAQKEAARQIDSRHFDITKLQAEEEKKEALYRRQEQEQY